MKTIFKIILLVSISWLNLNATIQKVNENYVIIQTAGDTYVGNELDQTYSLNPFLIGAGESIVILDQGGSNTIELVGGLTINSSTVVSNELLLALSNGAFINIRGADKFTFDIGANQVATITGMQQNFETFVTNTLGLEAVPTKGQPAVSGGVVSIKEGGGSGAIDTSVKILSDLTLSSDFAYIGTSKEIVARIALDGEVTKVELLSGNSKVIELKDDGNVANGDDILGDGIFSGKITVLENTVKDIEYQAKINDVKLSSKFTVSIISKFTNSEITEAKEVSANTLKVFPKNTKLTEDSLKNTLNDMVISLKNNNNVESVTTSNDKMFIKYTLKSGYNGGILFTTKNKDTGDSNEGGIRNVNKSNYIKYKNPFLYPKRKLFTKSNKKLLSKGASTNSTIGNTKVLILAPFEYAGVSGLGVKNKFDSNLNFKVNYLKDYEVTVEKFKNLNKYGVIVFRTHANKSGVILTGQEATEEVKKKYSLDNKKQRLSYIKHEILIEDGGLWYFDKEKETEVVLLQSSFISYYNKNLSNSLVYLGMCEGLMSGNPLPNIFISAGATSVVGFNNTVNTSYSNPIASTFFSEMLDGKTVQEGLDEAKKQHGNNDGVPTPAEPVFVGDADLTLFKKGIENGSFEENLKFWETEGDTRVIPKLAELKPQDGKLMNIISTGLGSNNNAYSYMQQSFTVPNNILKLQLKYDFISEEPMEYVGSAFDDKFEVHIIDEYGNDSIVVTETVNTSTWYAISGIDFDGGDKTTFHTKWKTSDINISQYQGKVITIKFLVYDKGDSIYDSAVLLDDVKLQ